MHTRNETEYINQWSPYVSSGAAAQFVYIQNVLFWSLRFRCFLYVRFQCANNVCTERISARPLSTPLHSNIIFNWYGIETPQKKVFCYFDRRHFLNNYMKSNSLFSRASSLIRASSIPILISHTQKATVLRTKKKQFVKIICFSNNCSKSAKSEKRNKINT